MTIEEIIDCMKSEKIKPSYGGGRMEETIAERVNSKIDYCIEYVKRHESVWVLEEAARPDCWNMVETVSYGTDFVILKDGETVEQALEKARSENVVVQLGYVSDDGFWYTSEGYPMIIRPTYWRPIPMPPKLPKK